MAAYAATVDEIDRELGRLLDAVEASGRADNTVVLFLSDNGADYSNGSRLTDTQQIPWAVGGNPTSSNGWAWVKNTPFRSYKHAAYEGGIASPLIVRWPAGLGDLAGTTVHAPAHIADLAPTFLELAGTHHPSEDAGSEADAAHRRLARAAVRGGRHPHRPAAVHLVPDDAGDGRRRAQGRAPLRQPVASSTTSTPTEPRRATSPPSSPSGCASSSGCGTDRPTRSSASAWRERSPPPAPTGWGQHRLEASTKNRLTRLTPANG